MKIGVTFGDLGMPDIDPRSFEPFALEQVGYALGRIKRDLGRGLNADGGSLREYSDSYKAHLLANKENTIVDLHRTGEMREAMQTQTIVGGAQIYFLEGHYSGMSAAGLAQTLEEKGFTDWFGLGLQDMERISLAVVDWLDSQFKS